MSKSHQLKLHSQAMIGFVASFMLLALLAASSCTKVFAQSQSQIIPFSDDWFNRQYDWVIYVGLSPTEKFLKYPSSTMTPLMRVPIEYRFCPNRSFRKSYPLQRQKYEELWYAQGKAVGVKRYSALPLSQYEQGALYIPYNTNIGTSIRELTNAMVRLVLDVYANRTILATIVVPKDYFENFADALTQYNFFKLTIVYPGGPGNNMSIHLVSNPMGTERYFYYDDSGRR
jgi:hypothetical protein